MQMDRPLSLLRASGLVLVLLSGAVRDATRGMSETVSLDPAKMRRIGIVNERYHFYNVEMMGVKGGKFWKPYDPDLGLRPGAGAHSGKEARPSIGSTLYQYQPPIDLANPRLRNLATAIGAASLRVSGPWANTTYFPETNETHRAPPAGFSAILTHERWKHVIDFVRKANAEIVTSFANGIGTRDAAGVWTSGQAKRFVEYPRELGSHIAAAEFMNEPNFAATGGAPPDYNAAEYARDFKIFHDFARQASPGMLILGPGSVGETTGSWGVAYGSGTVLKTLDLLTASRPVGVDAFSYHHYGALSQRCAALGLQITREAALSEEWLQRTDETLAFYQSLGDEFEPGKPFWLTETADAACGGNPWAKTFLDSFRYLDQLGRLARQGVSVVFHNTLVGSDYGLLDENTLQPRPNYWIALLWRRMMGVTVLDSAVPIQEGFHVYAHCLRGAPGGVALLLINNSRTRATSIDLTLPAERYTLTAEQTEAMQVRLNGKELQLSSGDELPELGGEPVSAGPIELAPASLTYLAIVAAGNASCG